MHGPKIHRAALGFLFLTAAYVVVLLWVDRGRGLLAGFDKLLGVLPLLFFCSLTSYLARHARWHWLLRRAGVHVRPLPGLLAYLAGFAFTVSPGKVGELVRIRYFQPLGASPELVLSAFVFERLFDLLVVLVLASLAVRDHDLLPAAIAFVASACALVFFLSSQPRRLTRWSTALGRGGFLRMARFLDIFARGFAGTRRWFTPLDLLVSIATGLCAWGLTAWSFCLLLQHLGVNLPTLETLPLYPLAMLAGVASGLPGGIGSTEVAIVVLLGQLGIDVALASVAAVGIRLATIWFATLLGLITLVGLEFRGVAKRACP